MTPLAGILLLMFLLRDLGTFCAKVLRKAENLQGCPGRDGWGGGGWYVKLRAPFLLRAHIFGGSICFSAPTVHPGMGFFFGLEREDFQRRLKK